MYKDYILDLASIFNVSFSVAHFFFFPSLYAYFVVVPTAGDDDDETVTRE